MTALRSLQGRSVRVAEKEIGTMSGPAVTMSDSAVVFMNSDRVAYVSIDSVWECSVGHQPPNALGNCPTDESF